MPAIDDQLLGALLHESAESFAVPDTGAADILLRAAGSGDGAPAPVQAAFDLGDLTPPSPHRFGQAIRSHRLLSVAASLVVLVALAGAGVLWVRSTPAPRVTAAAKAAHGAPSTTVPGSTGAGGKFGVSGGNTTNKGFNAAPSVAAAPSAPSSAGSATSGTASNATAALPPGEVGQPARIEQTGSLSLTVARGALTSTMAKLTSLAGNNNGFVANSQTQSGGSTVIGAPSGTVTLQVPVASFSAVLKDAQQLGTTTQLSTKATDVTSQYADLQDQITALQASRQQYLTIMTRASSIGDVLSVQEQLDSIQSQIQQLQGQLSVLTSETTYSTLTVNLNEKGVAHHHRTPPRPESGPAKAWHDSVHGFVAGVDGLIRIAGPLLFALLLLGALGLGGRVLWRRLQRHNL
jgi:Domain of unknown function (DUF4349)